jgi:hypothetical protein
MTIDYTVTWNADMSSATHYTASDFDTEVKITEIICDIQRTAATNLPSGITYTAGSGATNIDTAAGGTTTGVMLLNGLAMGDVDAVATEVETMDLCLEHASP